MVEAVGLTYLTKSVSFYIANMLLLDIDGQSMHSKNYSSFVHLLRHCQYQPTSSQASNTQLSILSHQLYLQSSSCVTPPPITLSSRWNHYDSCLCDCSCWKEWIVRIVTLLNSGSFTLERFLFSLVLFLIDLFVFGWLGFLEVVSGVRWCVGWGSELEVHPDKFSCEKLIE